MKRLLTFLIIGLAVSLGQQAFSSTGPLPLRVVAETADVIIVGRIGAITSVKKQVPSKEIGYAIWSTAEVFPERMIKGALDREPAVIEFAGGRVGETIQIVEDSPTFATGETVILFLKRIEGKTSYTTVGMSQGKYEIKEGTVARKRVPVEQFIKEIQDLIKNK